MVLLRATPAYKLEDLIRLARTIMKDNGTPVTIEWNGVKEEIRPDLHEDTNLDAISSLRRMANSTKNLGEGTLRTTATPSKIKIRPDGLLDGWFMTCGLVASSSGVPVEMTIYGRTMVVLPNSPLGTAIEEFHRLLA